MARFEFSHDVFIVTFFDTVGDLIATDIPHSASSIKKRAKLLRKSGVWDAILHMQRIEWATIRQHEMLSPTQRLMDLDAAHPGSMINACHFNDQVTAKEYVAETAEWFSECKASIDTQLQFVAEPDHVELIKTIRQK